MLSAEDIIILEKRWLKYKIKSKSKFWIFVIMILFSGVAIYLYAPLITTNVSKEKNIVIKEVQSTIKPQNQATTSYEAILPVTQKDSNITKIDSQNNVIASSKEENKTTNILLVDAKQKTIEQDKIKVENKIKWYLKIEPTLKGNDFFTTTAEVNFNKPIKEKINKVIQQTPPLVQEVKKENKLDIDISSSEIDTIKYLQNKFYSTENVVFAIMLSEELYNSKNYTESIKWALTANEIDAKNDKSWYWFAKNKIKLGQKDDAIKAIETFLSSNNSRRLSDLLKNIKYGEMND